MPIQASHSNKPNKTWFSMKASADDSALITIYDEIGGWGISAQQFAEKLIALGDVKNITLRLDSPGGDVFQGTTIYNLLSGHAAYVTCYIDGLAASMGSVIAMAADKIIMPDTAFMMIHKPWGGQMGDADDMRDYAELLDKVESTLLKSYVKKTGLDEAHITSLLAAETWMNGSEAVEAGFADELSDSNKTSNYFTSNRMKDYHNMPAQAKALMKPKAQVPNNPAPQGADEATIRAQILAADKTRREGIQNIFAMFGGKHKEIETECIADMECSVEMAKDKVLAALGKDTDSLAPKKDSIYAGNGNIVGDSIKAALMSRSGHEQREASNQYNHLSLRELARASLADRGIACATMAPMEMIAQAFMHTSSDFGNILIDLSNKSLLKGWEESEETFEKWTNEGVLSDFKTSKRVGLDGFGSLREVREGAEYKMISTNDHAEDIVLATYGEIFNISRQAIINDDLGAFTTIPMKMGRAAKATIADLVYAVLTKNPKMGDGNTLFHNDHGNIGTGAIDDVNSLDTLRKKMRMQKSNGRNLNIRPAFILGPIGQEAKANQTIRSSSVKGADINAGIINPIQNFAQYIGEPRLDDDSATQFYLAAGKGNDTIEVAYLDGVKVPYIEQQDGFTSDGVKTKVRIDAGVAATDYRGFVRSSGV
ncbi:peptidase S14 [Psychromonas sp. psych-6C06]|nr:peptidase S14 [Psychromonas sp. psych-6C06]